MESRKYMHMNLVKLLRYAIVMTFLDGALATDDDRSESKWQKVKNFIEKYKYPILIGIPMAYWMYRQIAYYYDLMGYGWIYGDPYVKNYIAIAAKRYAKNNKTEPYFKEQIKNAIDDYIKNRQDGDKIAEKLYKIYDLQYDPALFDGAPRGCHPPRDLFEYGKHLRNITYLPNGKYVRTKEMEDVYDELKKNPLEIWKKPQPELGPLPQEGHYGHFAFDALGYYNYGKGRVEIQDKFSNKIMKAISFSVNNIPEKEKFLNSISIPYQQAQELVAESDFHWWR